MRRALTEKGEMRRGKRNPRKMSTFKKKRRAGNNIVLEGKTREGFKKEIDNSIKFLQEAK